ncbi:hypothetical protein LINPERHAP2_LOCUS18650 [Linum perenne]
MAESRLVSTNGLMERKPADRRRYTKFFRNRDLLPNLRHFPQGFSKYGIHIYEPLFHLGWSNSIPSIPFPCYPFPVRMFYSNIRVLSSSPLELETQVLGHSIRLTPQLLARTQGGRDYGHTIHTEQQLNLTDFNVQAALSRMNIFVPPSVRPIPTRYIAANGSVDPLQCCGHQALQVIREAADPQYLGPLPLGAFITSLLTDLEIDIQFTVPDPLVWSIRAQHVLRKLALPQAPQRPKLDISKGGEQGTSFCCDKGKILSKLHLLAPSVEKKNEWNVPIKDHLKFTLGSCVKSFVRALKERGDWEMEDLENLDLGDSQQAENIKGIIVENYTKEPESKYASDYESDPEVEF